MVIKCRYCGREFRGGKQVVLLAAYHAHRRTCGPKLRRGNPVARGDGKAASRGKYAATAELIERVRMEGCLAYIDGSGREENPYEGEGVNMAWLEGWMVAQMAHKEGMQ